MRSRSYRDYDTKEFDLLSEFDEPDQFSELDEDDELFDEIFESEINRTGREYIRWVQHSLNRIMGLRLAKDGVSGPGTRSAIRSFQARQRLNVDGIVGARTEAALIASGATPPPSVGAALTSPPVVPGQPEIINVRGIRVARQLAPQLASLLSEAENAGIRLRGWGYRPAERQVELRRRHCGPSHYDIYDRPSSQCNPPTARPGRSMHERGLAIDFTFDGRAIRSRNDPAFRWLNANAARFGLYNLPSEPWHWSVNGQ